jgi:purine-binding chemotaxis protein CheW
VIDAALPEHLRRFLYHEDEDAGPLAELPVSGALPELPRAEAPLELLAFFLGDECYGVPLVKVREIVRVPPLTEVPRAAPNLLGVTNVRGEVMPVYDLKVRLKLATHAPQVAGPNAQLAALPKGARIVILRDDEGDAGILVDRVLEVLRISPAQVEPPPPGVGDRELVTGIGRRGDRFVIFLDVMKALA